MPAIGEFWRFVDISPTEEQQKQHAAIDHVSKIICQTMFSLAPTAKKRRWYSSYGITSEGEKISYAADDDPKNEMTVWLKTTNYGKSTSYNDLPHIEVTLMSQVKAISGAFYGRRGTANRRVTAKSDTLNILEGPMFSVNLKAIPFEDAVNILTDIGDTLELIRLRTGKLALTPHSPYPFLGLDRLLSIGEPKTEELA